MSGPLKPITSIPLPRSTSSLLPNPRMLTAWQKVYESMDNCAYITTMDINVNTFLYILSSGFKLTWNTMPIPCEDTSLDGQPCLGSCSLDAVGTLGLTLHYFSSAMLETSLWQIFAIIPSTSSRYLHFTKKKFYLKCCAECLKL
jgi:hypothetical protein